VKVLKFHRYSDVDKFISDVLDILLIDEARNNLLISILLDNKRDTAANWLLSTVTDNDGAILLIAICTPPFNLLIYESRTNTDITALELLASELKRIKFTIPGVIAERGLARRFADIYSNIFGNGHNWKMTMIIMKLDKLSEYEKAPGSYRLLTDADLSYTPSWECAFCVDCKLHVYTLKESEERIKMRLGMNIHYIWEDEKPVAQAVHGRSTPNGAAISWVYTPPEHRGHGYATSVVAELCKSILAGGKNFCCLFADKSNPASCAVYRKLGFYDVLEVDEIVFDTV